MPLTAVVFWVLYAAGVGAAVLNPVAGLALYIFVYHLSPESQWWGDSVRALGLRTSFTVALAAGVGMLIRWPRFRYGARQFPTVYILMIAFVVLALGSLAWGLRISERSLIQADKLVKLLILMFILLRCVQEPRHYHILIWSWLAGVLYLGYQAQGGVGSRIGGRLTGGLGGPDFAESSGLAVHLVATLPLIGAAFFMARTWLGRSAALLTGALAVNMIIMTRTRNALFGLAAMATVAVLALPRGYRARGLAAVAVGTWLSIQLTDPAWWRRMETIFRYDQDRSAVARLEYWKAALAIARDYPLGIGLGNFHDVVLEHLPGLKQQRSAHNTYLACLAETGWLGFLVFTLMILAALRALRRTRRRAQRLPPSLDVHYGRWHTRFHLGWHAQALQAALVGYLASALFTTRTTTEGLWLLLGFAAVLDNVSRSYAAQAPPETSSQAAIGELAPPATAAAVPRVQPP